MSIARNLFAITLAALPASGVVDIAWAQEAGTGYRAVKTREQIRDEAAVARRSGSIEDGEIGAAPKRLLPVATRAASAASASSASSKAP